VKLLGFGAKTGVYCIVSPKEKIVSALEKFLENLIHMIERKDWDKEWGGFESLVPIEEKIFLSYCFLKYKTFNFFQRATQNETIGMIEPSFYNY